jgi:teichuronic acid biosynthesis glycosyltransferase TuaG
VTIDYSSFVSIIMPAFNAAQTISVSIESVITQDYLDWELIVVNDNSSDNTSEIVMGYQAIDSRIALHTMSANLGPAGARNFGISCARGRWIAFLDSDDIWCESKLSLQLKFHKSNHATITYTQFRRISYDGRRIGYLIPVPKIISYHQLLGNTAIATSTVIIDCQAYGEKLIMKNVYYDDFACWLEILKKGGVAKGLQLDLMRYRVRPGSISRNKFKSAIEVWKIYRNEERLNYYQALRALISWSFFAFLKYSRF